MGYGNYLWQKISKADPIRLSGHSTTPHAILVRPNTSDLNIFWQVFINKEYGFVKYPEPSTVKTILDCGANIGYTSFYFLQKFPEARVIAIEPDSSNLKMAQENTKPYTKRIQFLQKGIWSHKSQLRIVREAVKGVPFSGTHCAFQVRECLPGEEVEVEAVSIPDIIEQYNLVEIDILKIDIENSEKIVFTADISSWIHKVKIIVIEIHPGCEETVHKALDPLSKLIYTEGELTVFDLRK
jgi:FkbM family methyltransferase